MRTTGFRLGIPALALYAATTGLPSLSVTDAAWATPAGDACRRQICDAAVEACMRADQSLNPFARTDADKKAYCGRFSTGCMSRSLYPVVPWYSPDVVARFLKCPS